MPKTVTKVAQIPKLQHKKRVAAYARVSSGKDAMLHSLSAQVSYYNDLIQKEDAWEFVGVYSDEAITGTKEERPGFRQMLEDCRNRKIDMILTKSISRFARNTVTLLETVRMLKALEVDVFFEEQNIHTMSSDGELMLTILASYAQEESRSASENQKWRIKKNFEEGMPWNGWLLGYRIRDGQYCIIPDEAELVRRIYSEYLAGDGYLSIAKRLNEDGIPSRFGGIWNQSVISKILSNYTYTGNLILQKTFRENHITKKTIINNGKLPKYHAEDSHDAIIPLETWQAVQAEKARRAARFHKKPAPKKSYPFSGLLVCDNCGKNYRRKTTRTGIVWVCSTFNTQGKAACASKQIPEETLQTVTADVLGQSDFDENLLRSMISSIRVCNGNVLVFRFYNGSEVTRKWKDRSRAESWTTEKRESARQKEIERRQAKWQEQSQ